MSKLQKPINPTPTTTTPLALTPENFVRAWQKANSSEEVEKIFGKKKGWASSTACRYRNANIKLKKMPRKSTGFTGRNKIDIDALNQIIKESNSE